MQRVIAAARRFLARARGAALVGYTSLMLLFAVAAVAMLGHTSGSAKPTRSANITSSD
jgi:Flp pilus assembly pilin Flp